MTSVQVNFVQLYCISERKLKERIFVSHQILILIKNKPFEEALADLEVNAKVSSRRLSKTFGKTATCSEYGKNGPRFDLKFPAT